MKKIKMISAVTAAVLTMSVNAMAMPINTNTFLEKIKSSQSCSNLETNYVLSNKINLNDFLKNSCVQSDSLKKITNVNIEDISKEKLNNCSFNNTNISDIKKPTSNNKTEAPTDTAPPSSNSGSANNNNNTENVTTPDKSETQTSVSSYASKVVELVNTERAKEGLSALQVDSKVAAAAQVRAKEVKSSFSHTRPDGRSCFTALEEAGVSYRGAGENIALGQKTPEKVVTDWMNSEGHRKNIMNPNFKYIGVGVDGTSWTQLFTY